MTAGKQYLLSERRTEAADESEKSHIAKVDAASTALRYLKHVSSLLFGGLDYCFNE